jgi:hypothetical protein
VSREHRRSAGMGASWKYLVRVEAVWLVDRSNPRARPWGSKAIEVEGQ